VALIAPRSSVAPASASIGSRDDVRSRKRRSDPASLDCLSIGRSTKRDDDRNAHARNASPPYSARSGIRGKTIASIPDPVVRLKCASSSLSSPYLSLSFSLSLSLSLSRPLFLRVCFSAFFPRRVDPEKLRAQRTDGRTDGGTENDAFSADATRCTEAKRTLHARECGMFFYIFSRASPVAGDTSAMQSRILPAA